MEKSCKECEHYELYDKDGWIMRCSHRVRTGKSSDGLYSHITICEKDFTPKKPKEEKTCDNCGQTSMNGGSGCDVLKDCDIDTHSHWQPIEKPKEEKTCGTCGNAMAIANTTNSTWCKKWGGNRKKSYFCDSGSWQPILKPDDEKGKMKIETSGQDYEAHVNLLNARLKSQKEHHRADMALQEAKLNTEHKQLQFMQEHSLKMAQMAANPPFVIDMNNLKGKIELTPKPTENKMLRLKKWIRRYVMFCTVYCTAGICIALNPWVCKLWYLIIPAKFEWEGKVDNAVLPVLLPWFFTACSIAAIIGAIIAFEKITAFVFGKLEK